MSTEVVRELFRNFENNLRDRLKVIEDILITSKSSGGEATSAVFSELNGRLHSLEDYTMGEIRTLLYNHDQLEHRVVSMESTLKKAVETLQTITSTIGSLQKRMDDERPVEAVEAEVELEETQEAALNADVDASATEKKAKVALAKAVEQLEEEVEVEEEEEEVEEEEEEVEEEEVEEEEVEEEEVEELELEEFQYKTKTYYRDQNSNVYIADEDGCVDANQVVGIWNPKTKKIERAPQA
jgi:chemotaxis protein histidine kinase CheA